MHGFSGMEILASSESVVHMSDTPGLDISAATPSQSMFQTAADCFAIDRQHWVYEAPRLRSWARCGVDVTMSDIMDDEAVEDEKDRGRGQSDGRSVDGRGKSGAHRADVRAEARVRRAPPAQSRAPRGSTRMIADQQRREGEEQWEADLRQGVANLSRQSPIPRNIDHWEHSRQPWKVYVYWHERRLSVRSRSEGI